LHDGRAQTLERAIAFHGGETAKPAHLFYGLSPQEQGQVIAFLRTLTAPAVRQQQVTQSVTSRLESRKIALGCCRHVEQ